MERQRFQFPNSWLHVDNVEGEWSAFNEIIRRKDCAIQVQVASLQVKIVAEDKAVEARTNDVLVEWEKSKPVEVCILFLKFFVFLCNVMYFILTIECYLSCVISCYKIFFSLCVCSRALFGLKKQWAICQFLNPNSVA